MKLMTRSEAEAKRRKAVEFLNRIGKQDEADKFEGMDAAEYARHKGSQLLENPEMRRKQMPRKTYSELQAELSEANDYIEELEGKLDDIAGIAVEAEDEEAKGGEEGDDLEYEEAA